MHAVAIDGAAYVGDGVVVGNGICANLGVFDTATCCFLASLCGTREAE